MIKLQTSTLYYKLLATDRKNERYYMIFVWGKLYKEALIYN